MSRIVVVGSSNTDMVVKSPTLPKPGETVMGGEFVTAAGGKGANQAVGAARLGGEVTFVARVGRDHLGEQAIAGFEREGIDVSHVVRDPDAPSGVALILVNDDGENLIAVAPGANANLSPDDVEKARPVIESADALLLQLEIPFESVAHAARIAHDAGVRVILDPAPAPKQGVPDDILSIVDILTPNVSEAEILSGMLIDTLDEEPAKTLYLGLRAKGVKTLILKAGEDGAWIVSGDQVEKIPAPKVRAVDATAAGDCFAGGLANALAEGRPLSEAVAFGCRAASIAVTRMGAQPSMPTRAEVDSAS